MATTIALPPPISTAAAAPPADVLLLLLPRQCTTVTWFRRGRQLDVEQVPPVSGLRSSKVPAWMRGAVEAVDGPGRDCILSVAAHSLVWSKGKVWGPGLGGVFGQFGSVMTHHEECSSIMVPLMKRMLALWDARRPPTASKLGRNSRCRWAEKAKSC